MQLHADYYARAVGFGLEFEAKVATELADFCRNYAPERDGLWLAVDGSGIEGSIAIDGSHQGEHDAHLRWFITSDRTRGTGIGTRLLRAALDFADARRHGSIFLWTFDDLHAARHLYEAHGFRLASSRRGSQWGKEVTEQRFLRAMP